MTNKNPVIPCLIAVWGSTMWIGCCIKTNPSHFSDFLLFIFTIRKRNIKNTLNADVYSASLPSHSTLLLYIRTYIILFLPFY